MIFGPLRRSTPMSTNNSTKLYARVVPKINEAVKHLGVKLSDSSDPFYFVSLKTGQPVGTVVQARYVTDLSLEQWVEAALHRIPKLDTDGYKTNGLTDWEHKQLATLIFRRWSCDLPAAATAWRRLFQNNCTDQQYRALLLPEDDGRGDCSECGGEGGCYSHKAL